MQHQPLKYCFIKQDFQAENADNPSQRKTFRAGKMISVSEYDLGDRKALISGDGYVIPRKYVEDVVDQKLINKVAKTQEVFQRINQDAFTESFRKIDFTVNGAVFGGIAGMGYALVSGKSFFVFGLLGATVGVVVGYGISGIKHFVNNDSSDTNDSKPALQASGT